jgi:hypothetical protein
MQFESSSMQQMAAALQHQIAAAIQHGEWRTALLLVRDAWAFLTGHRPKEIGEARWTWLSDEGGAELVPTYGEPQHWPQVFIYKPARNKTHQLSTTPVVQPIYISARGGRHDSLYTLTQQLWCMQQQAGMARDTRAPAHVPSGAAPASLPYGGPAVPDLCIGEALASSCTCRTWVCQMITPCAASSGAACSGCTPQARPRWRSCTACQTLRPGMCCCGTWTPQHTGTLPEQESCGAEATVSYMQLQRQAGVWLCAR